MPLSVCQCIVCSVVLCVCQCTCICVQVCLCVRVCIRTYVYVTMRLHGSEFLMLPSGSWLH